MRFGLLRLITLLVFGVGLSHAATVQWLDLKELNERSPVVFVGEVVEQSTRLAGPPHRVFTQTLFKVDEVLKGEMPSLWTLEQLGGIVGVGAARIEQRVPGYPRFTVGERVVLFLERTDTDALVVTGLAQGKYRLKTTAGTTMAERSLDGLELVRPARSADIHLAGVPKSANRVSLNQLRDIISGRSPTPVPLRVMRPGVEEIVPMGTGPLGGQQ